MHSGPVTPSASGGASCVWSSRVSGARSWCPFLHPCALVGCHLSSVSLNQPAECALGRSARPIPPESCRDVLGLELRLVPFPDGEWSAVPIARLAAVVDPQGRAQFNAFGHWPSFSVLTQERVSRYGVLPCCSRLAGDRKRGLQHVAPIIQGTFLYAPRRGHFYPRLTTCKMWRSRRAGRMLVRPTRSSNWRPVSLPTVQAARSQ